MGRLSPVSLGNHVSPATTPVAGVAPLVTSWPAVTLTWSVTHAEPPWLAPSAGHRPEAKGLPTRVAALTACSSRVRRWEVSARDVEAPDDREPEPEATRPCPCPRPEDR